MVEAVELLCLSCFSDQPVVLAQTGSEQLWHNMARMFTVPALLENVINKPSEKVTRMKARLAVPYGINGF